MAFIHIKKELAVVADLALGMGEIAQSRGTGKELNADYLPYSDTKSTKVAIDEKIDRAEMNLKMDKAGGEFTGSISGQYPTKVTELATVGFVLNNGGSGSGITWQGRFTPVPNDEYPTISPDVGDGWFIILGAPYTYTSGTLAGQTAEDKDQLIFTKSGWAIISLNIGDTTFYRLDGTNNLKANFNASGYRVINMDDGVDDADGVTVAQLRLAQNEHKLDDLKDVNTQGAVEGDALTWDDTLKIWKAGATIPPTLPPILSASTINLIQLDSGVITIVNHSSTATYTATSTDDAVATATVTGDKITIASADLVANATAIISITAKEPDLLESEPVTVSVTITYVPFVGSSIINDNFQANADFVDGFAY